MSPTPIVDLGPIRDALWREGDGRVSLERIDAVLEALLESDFRDARVVAYVPIFLHRAARDSLWSELH